MPRRFESLLEFRAALPACRTESNEEASAARRVVLGGGSAALDVGPMRECAGLYSGEPTLTGEGYVGIERAEGERHAAVRQVQPVRASGRVARYARVDPVAM